MTPRLTVTELFERGFRRNRKAPLAIAGATCTGAEENSVSFSLAIADGRIAAVGFRTSCCATLIAYCEYIAQIAPGFRPALARELTAANLVESVPGVPALKRDRAMLAITGFRAALLAADPAFVIPGRAEGANPESIKAETAANRVSQGLWIPGSSLRSAPE